MIIYRVVEVDGIIRACVCKNNVADKYGIPKNFKTKEDAQKWIDRHSYKGISFKYEIAEIEE